MALLAFGSSTQLAACGSSGGTATEVRSSKVRVTSPTLQDGDLATLVADNSRLAWDLYQAIHTMPGNLTFSPASISLALAMAYGGARNTTAHQMASTLHFTLAPERLHLAFDALDLALEAPPSDPSAFQLSLANAVWARQGLGLLPDYLDLLATSYGAGVHVVDFAHAPEAARAAINRWVSDETHAKIAELLAPGTLDPDTAVVLTNAVYFHADWRSPFDADSPKTAFQTPAGPVAPAWMEGDGKVLPSWSGAGYRAVAIPYVGDTISMVLVVPDAGTFEAFEGGLTSDGLAAILAGAPTTGVTLTMPLFSFQTKLGLARMLAAMGMPDAFSGAADFSGIDGARDLTIQDVIHQTMVSVDVTGTEAAGATAVPVQDLSAEVGEPFVVDRPFLFVIRDGATGTILFLGRVVDPTKS